MLKDITIMKKNVGKMLVKAFVLLESEKTTIYIPLNLIQQRDYDRLKDISQKKNYSSMLEAMKATTLDNGRNALVVYDGMIRIQHHNEIPEESYRGQREKQQLEEKQGIKVDRGPEHQKTETTTEETTSTASESNTEGEQPKKRGRGRPPKNKQAETSQ